MLFLTNRMLNEEKTREVDVNRSISFNLDDNAASKDVYFCNRANENSYTELGSTEFLKALKKSKAKQILFYIHGFSNIPEPDIFPRAEALQTLFDNEEKNLIEIVPIIWPCDNDLGIVKDYWDDQKSADQSAFAFARAFEMFMNWAEKSDDNDPCLKRINVLAHSMGNRVLRETLNAWNKYDLSKGVPLLFRNTFLVAADIVNESLEHKHLGKLICDASRNVSVYFASDDLALRSSKITNLKNKVASRRLGHSGPENIKNISSNVYSIDCDNFNITYDKPKGHSYFLHDNKNNPGKVFKHICKSIQSGRVIVDNQKSRTTILEE